MNLVGRIQNKSPPIIFSLASLGFGGNLSQLFFVNNPSILLRPDKYNKNNKFNLFLILGLVTSRGEGRPKYLIFKKENLKI